MQALRVLDGTLRGASVATAPDVKTFAWVDRRPGCSSSGPAGMRYVDRLGQHDAVRGAAAAVMVGDDVERLTVFAAEHAGEAAAIGLDRLQHFATLGDTGAALAFGAYRAVVHDSPDNVRAAAWAEVAETLKTFETPTGFVAPAEVLVTAGVTSARDHSDQGSP